MAVKVGHPLDTEEAPPPLTQAPTADTAAVVFCCGAATQHAGGRAYAISGRRNRTKVRMFLVRKIQVPFERQDLLAGKKEVSAAASSA